MTVEAGGPPLVESASGGGVLGESGESGSPAGIGAGAGPPLSSEPGLGPISGPDVPLPVSPEAGGGRGEGPPDGGGGGGGEPVGVAEAAEVPETKEREDSSEALVPEGSERFMCS